MLRPGEFLIHLSEEIMKKSLVLFTLLLSACSTPKTSPETAPESTVSEKVDDQKKPHWGYTGDVAPANWANLDPSFSTCATGTEQSPINIVEAIPKMEGKLETSYTAGGLSVINNGHTIQGNLTEKTYMVANGRSFELLQLHFHTPSENTLMGKSFPMEVHFVHKDADGGLGVLGVFIEEGAANEALASIWANAPATKDGEANSTSLNPTALLPASRNYYSFAGSLTTPPCSEGVAWHVLDEPITASADQIATFQSLFPMNARPVQTRN